MKKIMIAVMSIFIVVAQPELCAMSCSSSSKRSMGWKKDLFMAATIGDAAWIQKLLAQPGAQVDACDRSGVTALMCAVSYGQKNAVKALLDAGAAVNGRDFDGCTALYHAVKNDREGLVRYLIERGADVKVCTIRGLTPLMKAAVKGRIDIVQILLDSGAYVNEINEEGKTPFFYALITRHSDMACFLVHRCKGDVTPCCADGTTALMAAVKSFQRASINLVLDEYERIARAKAHENLLRALLILDGNSNGDMQFPPEHCRYMLEPLLAASINDDFINARDDDEHTALWFAQHGVVSVDNARLLIDAGAHE